MLQNTEWCNDKKDNPEKLETQRTQDVEKKKKTQHNMHWTPPYANKTCIHPPTNNWRQRRTEHRFYEGRISVKTDM